MDETTINSLNSEIQKLKTYSSKSENELSDMDKIFYDNAKSTVRKLLIMTMNSVGVTDAEEFVKVAPLQVTLSDIVSILSEDNLKFKIEGNRILVGYDYSIFNFYVTLFFEINNYWISSNAYISDKIVNMDNNNEILEILNTYNYKTRHSKVVIDDNSSLALIRNDNTFMIWDFECLRKIIMSDIIIMTQFFSDYGEQLQKYLIDRR